MTIEVMEFRPYEKGSLQGFANLFVPKMGLEIYGCALHKKEGRKWINLPQREYNDPDTGDTKYIGVVRFRERAHADSFCKAALHAIESFVQQPSEPKQAEGAPF